MWRNFSVKPSSPANGVRSPIVRYVYGTPSASSGRETAAVGGLGAYEWVRRFGIIIRKSPRYLTQGIFTYSVALPGFKALVVAQRAKLCLAGRGSRSSDAIASGNL